jgi:subtilisin-like proprotein convertase family protein
MNSDTMHTTLRYGCYLLLSLAIALGIGNSQAGISIFSNTSFIALTETTNSTTIATPYPSTITVTNLPGQVIDKVAVTLNGLSHTFPSDIVMLLAGPGSQTAVLMAEVGGQDKFSVTNLTLTLDDKAHLPLPVYTSLSSGTFQPFNAFPLFGFPTLPFDFPSPAAPGTSNSPTALSVFKGTDPNGTWSLFVLNDGTDDFGSISGGWSLNITSGFAIEMAQAGTNVVISWPTNAQNFQLQANPNILNPNLWYTITPVRATNAGRYSITNPISSPSAFFRLIQPQ